MNFMWATCPNPGTSPTNYPIHTLFGVPSINFFTGTSINKPIPTITSGAILLMICSGITVISVSIRSIFRFLRWKKKIKKKKDRKNQLNNMSSPVSEVKVK